MSIRRALLVGINDYLSPEVPDLRGCVNDVAAWHDLLVRRGSFPEQGIVTLLDGDATGLAIRSELERLLVDSKPGDVAFFAFSGHGTLTLTIDPTEATGVNQALCAADMDWENPTTFLEDDWICARICASRPGVAIRFIPDCCHSGSMTRTLGPPRSPAGHLCLLEPSARRSDLPDPPPPLSAAWVHARFAAPPPGLLEEAKTPPVPVSKPSRRRIPVGSDVLVCGACQDEQTSADYFSKTYLRYHGAHSRYLVDALDSPAGLAIERKPLMTRIRRQIKAGGFDQIATLDASSPRGPFLELK
jgi:metacaspase-1